MPEIPQNTRRPHLLESVSVRSAAAIVAIPGFSGSLMRGKYCVSLNIFAFCKDCQHASLWQRKSKKSFAFAVCKLKVVWVQISLCRRSLSHESQACNSRTLGIKLPVGPVHVKSCRSGQWHRPFSDLNLWREPPGLVTSKFPVSSEAASVSTHLRSESSMALSDAGKEI